MSDPFVSIVTLSLERREHTERFIAAVHRYTRSPFELIVVSQESDPDTVRWLDAIRSGHPAMSVLWNERNVGTAVGRNQGARLARGDWLAFVDNDVEVGPGWLEAMLATAGRDDSVGAVGAKILTSQGITQYCSDYLVERRSPDLGLGLGLHFGRVLRDDSPLVSADAETPWYPTTCLLVRREAFDRAGGFDETYAVAEEDKDLSLALRGAGYRILFSAAASVVHHSHPRSESYRRHREDFLTLKGDRARFEEKWNCRVIHECTRRYLQELGVPERQIQRYEKFPVHMVVVPEQEVRS